MSVKGKARYGRACLLALDTCPFALKRVIEHHYTTHGFTDFDTFLDHYNQKHQLFHLRFQKCCLVHCTYTKRHTQLRSGQWDLLYMETLTRNPHGDRGKCPCMYTAIPGLTTHDMDVTLCCLLLRHICPGVNISHIEDISTVRNQLMHARSATLDDTSFKNIWSKVKTALLSLALALPASFQSELKDTLQETRSGFCDLSNLERLMAHEKRIESLKEELESTETNRETIDQRLDTLETDVVKTYQRVTTLEKHRVKTDQRVTKLETDEVKSDERVMILETGVVKSDQRVTALEADRVNTVQRVTTLETDGAKTDQRVTKLETDGVKSDERVMILETDVVKSDQRVTALEADRVNTVRRVTRLEADLVNTDRRVTRLKTDGVKTDQRVKALEAGGVKRDHRMTKLETDGVKTDQRITALDADLVNTYQRVTTLETNGVRTDQRVTELEADGVNTNQRVTTLEEDNTVINEKMARMEKPSYDRCQTHDGQKKVLEALLKINTRVTENIQISLLQKSLKTTEFANIYVPPLIREDLEKDSTDEKWPWKSKESGTNPEQKASQISSPQDLFYKNGELIRYIFLQGEAGHGKTVFCQNLVRQWCRAKQMRGKEEELSEWEKSMDEFDFVFMIKLRHVQKSITSISDMVCYDLFKHFGSCHDDLRRLIKSGNCRSLFIIDGLDEWKIPPEIREKLVNEALPDIDCTSDSTFLFTYRPWKHTDLLGEIKSCDRVVQILGFDEERKKIAIRNVLKILKLPDSSKETIEKKSDEFIRKSEKIGLKSILGIPLLVPLFVILCHESKFDEKIVTSFYISLVQYLIKLALEKKSVSDSFKKNIVGKTELLDRNDEMIFIPGILQSSSNKTFRDFLLPLTQLGRIAYNGLISSETSLEFSKEDLENILGSSVLEFSLTVGLLNQCQAPGCFDEENVSLNFFHKSVQEFLAATYVVCLGEVAIEKLCRDLSSVKVILDLSEVLKFVWGLSPYFGSVVSRHIVEICDQEEILKQKIESTLLSKYNLASLSNMEHRCYLEMKNNKVVQKTYPVYTHYRNATKRKDDIQYGFVVVYFDDFYSKISLDDISDLFDDLNVDAETVYVDMGSYNSTEINKLETSLNQFLLRTKSLKHIILRCPSRRSISLQGMNKNLILKSVDLRGVRLSRKCLHQLARCVISSRQLQTLKLADIGIEKASTNRSKGEVIYRRNQNFLDIRKKSKKTLIDLWNILPECPNLTTLHIDQLSFQDTIGRKTLLKILPNLNNLQEIEFRGRDRSCDWKSNCKYDCSASDSVIKMIIRTPKLEKIDLSYLFLTEELTHGMLKVQELYLTHVKLNSKCLDYIFLLPKLRDLYLCSIAIPKVNKHINVVLPNLRYLDLWHINLGDNVLELASKCKMVEKIELFNITMSASGWKRLFTSLPKLNRAFSIALSYITMSAELWTSFVTSILECSQSVGVELSKADIVDETLRMITLCPHVKVTKNEKDGEKRIIWFTTNVQFANVRTK